VKRVRAGELRRPASRVHREADLALDDNRLLQHAIAQHVADGHLDLDAALDAIDATQEYDADARRQAIDQIDRLLDNLAREFRP
jgi:hypothetical protein